MSDIDTWLHQLKRGDILKETEVKILCLKAKEILQNEDNVIKVEAPVTVRLRCLEFRYAVTYMASFTI